MLRQLEGLKLIEGVPLLNQGSGRILSVRGNSVFLWLQLRPTGSSGGQVRRRLLALLVFWSGIRPWNRGWFRAGVLRRDGVLDLPGVSLSLGFERVPDGGCGLRPNERGWVVRRAGRCDRVPARRPIEERRRVGGHGPILSGARPRSGGRGCGLPLGFRLVGVRVPGLAEGLRLPGAPQRHLESRLRPALRRGFLGLRSRVVDGRLHFVHRGEDWRRFRLWPFVAGGFRPGCDCIAGLLELLDQVERLEFRLRLLQLQVHGILCLSLCRPGCSEGFFNQVKGFGLEGGGLRLCLRDCRDLHAALVGSTRLWRLPRRGGHLFGYRKIRGGNLRLSSF